MLNNELKRNGSGYYDGTPYNAVLCNPEAGDVYESGMNKIYLILKNHGKFSIALALFTIPNSSNKTDCEVTVEDKKFYSNPAMLQYVFNDIFMKRVGTLEADAFMDVMETVGDSLGVAIKVSKEPADEQANEWEAQRKALVAERDSLKFALSRNSENMVYKGLYYELLDRIIGKGGVSGER